MLSYPHDIFDRVEKNGLRAKYTHGLHKKISNLACCTITQRGSMNDRLLGRAHINAGTFGSCLPNLRQANRGESAKQLALRDAKQKAGIR